MAPDYIFRPMNAAYLPLVRRWLALPHVPAWGVEKHRMVDTPDGPALLMVRDA